MQSVRRMRRSGGKYSRAYVRALLARVKIEEVVADFVKLRRVNDEYAYGLCPFHPEQSPSFTVSEAKGFCHCFGCGWHGDAVWFLVDYHSRFHKARHLEEKLRAEEHALWKVEFSAFAGEVFGVPVSELVYSPKFEAYQAGHAARLRDIERYMRRYMRSLAKRPVREQYGYLDAIRYLARKYRYWPSQHRRLEKRLRKQ